VSTQPRRNIFYFSPIVCPDVGLPSRCPQVVWCHWAEVLSFSATLAQDELAELTARGKSLKYSATIGNQTMQGYFLTGLPIASYKVI